MAVKELEELFAEMFKKHEATMITAIITANHKRR